MSGLRWLVRGMKGGEARQGSRSEGRAEFLLTEGGFGRVGAEQDKAEGQGRGNDMRQGPLD